jgi:hypothetical protein
VTMDWSRLCSVWFAKKYMEDEATTRTICVEGEPYANFIFCENMDSFDPIHTPSHVGQHVEINWDLAPTGMQEQTAGCGIGPYDGDHGDRAPTSLQRVHPRRPIGVCDRCVTDVFVDSRGGWTCPLTKRVSCHSHPIVRFY